MQWTLSHAYATTLTRDLASLSVFKLLEYELHFALYVVFLVTVHDDDDDVYERSCARNQEWEIYTMKAKTIV